MKDLTSINNLKSSSRKLIVISGFLFIFGLWIGHIPTISLATAIAYWAYGLMDSVVRLYEKNKI